MFGRVFLSLLHKDLHSRLYKEQNYEALMEETTIADPLATVRLWTPEKKILAYPVTQRRFSFDEYY